MSSQPLFQAKTSGIRHSTQHARKSCNLVVSMARPRSARKKTQLRKKASPEGQGEEAAHNRDAVQPVDTETAPQNGGLVPPAPNGSMTPKHETPTNEKTEAVSSSIKKRHSFSFLCYES